MMARNESKIVADFVTEITAGKPFVFMIMPYKEGYAFFEKVQKIVGNSVGLACIRADHVHASGHDLLAKIHLLIDRSELVMADISTHSPNVFYEVGYAVGTNKPMLLLSKADAEMPTDLKGMEKISYRDDREGIEKFSVLLAEHLVLRLNSNLPILRDMLQAKDPNPSFILASPKPPGPQSRIRGQVYDQRTFSDNMGVLGLIQAFGAFMGERADIELISAEFCSPNILEEDVNLYLIGSDKVNPITKELLPKIQQEGKKWIFAPLIGEKQDGDYINCLYEDEISEARIIRGNVREVVVPDGGETAIIHTMDYGIIIRAPHPNPAFSNRIILIMAGPHSLGTGAACLAATHSSLIRDIQAALPNKRDLADKSKSIWALVQGRARENDYMLDVDGVSIIRAGTFE